jgi:tripartite-type tricarboxylate transporter receptor subunit TctC
VIHPRGEIRYGTLKALATSASKRTPILPNVPTVRELGYADMELEGWNGLFAKRLTELGAEPVGSTPAEQEAILRRQIDQFRPVIRDMKLD